MNKKNYELIEQLFELINDNLEYDGHCHNPNCEVYAYVTNLDDRFMKWLLQILIRLDLKDLKNHLLVEEI